MVAFTADLQLFASSRRFRLPAAGSRSIVIAVGEPRQSFGAVIVSPDGSDLVPGARVVGAVVTPWAEDADLPSIAVGDRLTLWMGGDVGVGVVTGLDP